MTHAEAMECRAAAQMYRVLREENQKLRDQLAEKHRIDLRMQAEDEEVFALVNSRKPVLEVITVKPTPEKPVFDFDTAEIEPLDAELIEYLESDSPAHRKDALYYIRFAALVLVECGIWTAHHFGFMDWVLSLTFSIFVFLLANYFRFI